MNDHAAAIRRTARLHTPTSLGVKATHDISAALNALLADFFALYVKTKNFHSSIGMDTLEIFSVKSPTHARFRPRIPGHFAASGWVSHTAVVGALPRSRRPPCRRALACLRSRCLRAKAAEKELQTTTPLTAAAD